MCTMNILLLLLFFVTINSAPIEDDTKADSVSENVVNNKDSENSDEQSRAGIIDTINPFNKNENSGQSTNKDKASEENSNPLATVQNFFNGDNNPIGQLFSSQSGSNMLDNIKIFLVASQGMVMPASAALGGFQDLIQNIGNMGNAVQGAQNLLPTLPTGK